MTPDDQSMLLRRDYTTQAEKYDDLRYGGKEGKFMERSEAAIVRELTGKTRASLCLDVPVGTGRVESYLEGESIKIVGCDFTEAMLKVSKKRHMTNTLSLVRGDAARLPFSSESFDLIICLSFFHLFPSDPRRSFVAEFERVLRPGGYLLCSFTNGWYGGGLNWVRKSLGRFSFVRKGLGRCGVYFLMPGEIRRLFPNWNVCASRGNFLPFQRFISVLSERAEVIMRPFTAYPPLKQLCYTRFYLLKKLI